jgi:hypothetical protein
MNTPATVRYCATLLAFGFFTVVALAGDAVAVLKTRTETYANVTLVSRTATHLFVQHSRGVANLKIRDLDAVTLQSLGIEAQAGSATGSEEGKSAKSSGFFSANAISNVSLPAALQQLPAGISIPSITKSMLLPLVAGFVLCYLFFSYCAMLICKKAATEPGILVWLPVVQILPLIRAARMSGWWFVAWLVPGVNIVAQILWCLNIAKARGKGVFTGILLILPVTGIFAFLYLAFSGGQSDSTDNLKPLKFEPLPA